MRVAAPPVFLDRDGTLIVEKNYLSDPEEVCLEKGVLEGLTTLKQCGHALIVLSNQSGIGRGMFKESDAHRVNARVADILRGYGIDVLAWYICPHAPEAMCTCRKPLAGMALTAASDWNLELSGSYVIGDKQVDLELAEAIGRPLRWRSEVVDAARELQDLGAQTVLVSLGAAGAILVDESVVVGESPVDQPRSAVGAGDAFLAGFLASQYLGASRRDAFAEALAWGAAAVRLPGTRMPGPDDIDRTVVHILSDLSLHCSHASPKENHEGCSVLCP